MTFIGLLLFAALSTEASSIDTSEPALALPRMLGSTLQTRPGECALRELVTPSEREYLRLVNLYRSGSALEAVRALGNLGAGAVKRMIRRGAPGMKDACLQAASLLETELAMTLAERSLWENADAGFHTAWEISFLIWETERRAHFQRDWLLAVGLFHHQLIFFKLADEAFGRAEWFLRLAVERNPDDFDTLLAAGALLEWSGSLRGGNPSHLEEAEELYARALRLGPENPTLLLRHGWVLEKLGRRDEAARCLLRVLELGAADDVVYRSHMLLGKIAEAAGGLPEAIAHYEAASAAIPSWQVAYLALGHALHASGSHDNARSVIDRALSMDVESADEAYMGWWSYELGFAQGFDPLFSRMRAEVRQ